jgi:hypothetical protein
MLYFVALTVLLALVSCSKAQCNGGTTLQQLNFDEFTFPDLYTDLSTPYKGFNIVKGGSNPAVPLLNTAHPDAVPYYSQLASSPTNIIFTGYESLTITYSSQQQNLKTFAVFNFTMASVYYDNQRVIIQASRDGKIIKALDVTLRYQVVTPIVLNQNNVDRLYITCFNQSIDTCAHMAFDTFMLCH